MTDNEIIKALEGCWLEGNCEHCPMKKDNKCKVILRQIALDLINRKNAEIERLKHNIEILAICKKDLPEQTAKAIKAEAVKEFAERLKERGFSDKYYEHEAIVYVADIDNLVKEMVGES